MADFPAALLLVIEGLIDTRDSGDTGDGGESSGEELFVSKLLADAFFFLERDL